MTDLNLTADEWRMVRQAGAAFSDESPTAVETTGGQQLMFAGTGPAPGELYRNVHTGAIGCVVKVRQARYAWATLRVSDRLTDVSLDWLGEHWRPCRPDGTFR